MSALNFNKVTLAGHLTTTPELKQTTTGISVCTFNLAINRRRSSSSAEQIADFITCQAWRQTAELICKYFKKGSALMITGSLQVRSWQDKDGNNIELSELCNDDEPTSRGAEKDAIDAVLGQRSTDEDLRRSFLMEDENGDLIEEEEEFESEYEESEGYDEFASEDDE